MMNCPYCETKCEADFVDIGVGEQQCGPYVCEKCGAVQLGPNDSEEGLSEIEARTGFRRGSVEQLKPLVTKWNGLADDHEISGAESEAYCVCAKDLREVLEGAK